MQDKVEVTENSSSLGAPRESLKSRLGFILLSAGCAIGIGNVWKFPYMVGKYGGGIFVLFYLLFLITIGIPVMTMEFSLGRASRKSPVLIHKALTPEKKPWRAHGYGALVANVILMMFYVVVTGWLLQYFVKTAMGDFSGLNSVAINNEFVDMTLNPGMQILYTAIVVIIGFVVCGFGVQKSLEKVTKYMMLALLGIMVVLVINSFTMSGAGEGLKFYLVPDFSKVEEVGLFNVISGAMCQSFFTLSLGIGSMAIFGSYIEKDRSLLGESVNVAVLDTSVAFMAGLIIFPALFTYSNGQATASSSYGPPLIFQVLPNIFANMPGGRIWGSLFFLFLSFAALSTVFAVFENIIAMVKDLTNLKRWQICVIGAVAMFILSIPCVLGFNVWSGFTPFGAGSNILDLEDFLVSNLALPIGTFCFVLYCTSKYGWGYDNFLTEANLGKGMKIKPWMKNYFKYVLPVLTAVFIVISLVTFFA